MEPQKKKQRTDLLSKQKIVYLPFAEALHQYNYKEWNIEATPSEEGQELFRKITKKLKVKYNPSKIKDPALEELQSRLLALAFDIKTEIRGEIQMPDAAKQDERIEQYLEEFLTLFGGKGINVNRKAAPSKVPSAKVAKISDQDLSVVLVVNLIVTNKVESLNKDQLFNFLKEQKAKVTKSMSKAVLVENVLDLRPN